MSTHVPDSSYQDKNKKEGIVRKNWHEEDVFHKCRNILDKAHSAIGALAEYHECF